MASEVNMEVVSSIVRYDILWTENVRGITRKFLIPVEGSEEAKDPKKMGDAILAVEVVISLVNVFRALISGDRMHNAKAIVDLTFGLNTNLFWTKNAGYLMPLVNSAVNSVMDYQDSIVNPNPLYDRLAHHNKYAWLDIPVAVLYALNGFEPMRKYSLEFKQSLETVVK